MLFFNEAELVSWIAIFIAIATVSIGFLKWFLPLSFKLSRMADTVLGVNDATPPIPSISDRVWKLECQQLDMAAQIDEIKEILERMTNESQRIHARHRHPKFWRR